MFKILFLSLFLTSCQTSQFWNTEPYYVCDTRASDFAVCRVKFPASEIDSIRHYAKEHPNNVWNIQGPFNLKK